jgi:nucleotide-binding universal stress UspA family protein
MSARRVVTVVDWQSFDLEEFTRELRGNLNGPDADKLIWAFEEAVEVARTDEDLLSYLVVASLCLLARLDESSPRAVLEVFFRQSVTDEDWRRTYLPLFA